MALPPHVIWKQIQEMPEGDEKQKRLKSFHTQMKLSIVTCYITFFAMIGFAIFFIGKLVVRGFFGG